MTGYTLINIRGIDVATVCVCVCVWCKGQKKERWNTRSETLSEHRRKLMESLGISESEKHNIR
jgi:hypothetical protein